MSLQHASHSSGALETKARYLPESEMAEAGWAGFAHPLLDDARFRIQAAPASVLRGPAIPIPNSATVPGLIEAQASLTPQRRAFVHGERTLTYGETERMANALARELRARSVGRNDLVSIVCGNGLVLPVAMLAVMKAGGAFVPVDEDWPAERIETVLRRLAPKVVLEDVGIGARYVAPAPRLAVDLHVLGEAAAERSDFQAFQEDLAYGFFTSGSTGEPKCCLNSHRGLVNRFLYMTHRYGPRGDDVVLQNSRHVFDSSIWQLLWPLTNGASVVLPERHGGLDLDALMTSIRRHRVTMTDFVPSVFNLLVGVLEADPAKAGLLRSLRRLLIGGEEINEKAAQSFSKLLPEVGLTNTYGHTEASIGMVFHEVGDGSEKPIPLGRPIANTFALVTDEHLLPLPPGETGEILVGGACVGQGYLGDPAGTAYAFPANPFLGLEGTRLYRTGDLGCIDDLGRLVFKGRRDSQIKLNGIRLEPGEIEAALMACEPVREARVVVRRDEGGGIRLVAFVTGAGEIDPSMLRRALSRRLPAAIVPREIRVLEQMPLTANGKVDRRTLASMLETTAPAQSGEEKPIRSSALPGILGLWRRHFCDPGIDADSNFLELGGDSLQAVKLTLEMQRLLGVEVAVRDLYGCLTPRSLGRLLERREGRDRPPEASPSAGPTPLNDPGLVSSLFVQPGTGPSGPPRTILLTGATGFLGTHLLASLLSATDARIFCLVRSESDACPRGRLERALASYGLDGTVARSGRVIPVPGDLAKPCLGLDEGTGEDLAGVFDTVVVNGASVNLLKDYGELRDCNVLGTFELLRLAGRSAGCRVHFVSSLSVFGSPVPKERIGESGFPEEPPPGGYHQTKWVGERMIELARERGLDTHVYRLGELMPGAAAGIPNVKAEISLLIGAALRFGCYPEELMTFDYTPVDLAGRILAQAIAEPDADNRMLHLFNPHPCCPRRLLESLARGRAAMAPVSLSRFADMLEAACRNPAPAPDLLALVSLLPVRGSEESVRWRAHPREIFFHDHGDALAKRAIGTWPQVTDGMLEPFARYMDKAIRRMGAGA